MKDQKRPWMWHVSSHELCSDLLDQNKHGCGRGEGTGSREGELHAHRLASFLTPSPLPCCDTTNKRWEENTLAGTVTEGHRWDCAVGSPFRGWKSLLLMD